MKGDPVKVSAEGVNSQVYFRGDQAANAQAYGETAGKILTFLSTEYGLAPQATSVHRRDR